MFAAGAEIPYVMAQVGHEDSKKTLEIYARVLKRRDRDDIGKAFDHLLLGRVGAANASEERSLTQLRSRHDRGERARNRG